MTPATYYLFVYGSLRSGFPGEAYEYISRYFDLRGIAKVKGLLYDMGEYPAAIPVHDDHFIRGELYEIKRPVEFDWAFAQLDDYEGLHVEQGEEPLYRRDLVGALLNDQTITAWIYWYNGDVSGKPVIKSGDVLQYLREKIK
jgi:gamma-glutamylcyclotransferase (GGCT)/AIG2-like uncharacterized protein YtfP